jgi:hypothetical protein
MFSGRYEFWKRDAVQELSCFGKFCVSGSLSKITADDHEVRTGFFYTCNKIFRRFQTVPSEMQVRDMNYGAHSNY